MTRGLVALVICTVMLVAVQITIISPLRIAGVVVMLVWLWPVSLALTGRTVVSVGAGFVTGLLFDTHSLTPFGLTGVVGVLLALAAAQLGREGVGDLDAAAWWVTPALAAAAGFSAPLIFIILGFLTGHTTLWRGNLGVMMVVNAVAFFVLARPLTRLAQRVAESGGWSRT